MKEADVVRLFDGNCSGAPVQRFATLLTEANVPQEWTLADAVGIGSNFTL